MAAPFVTEDQSRQEALLADPAVHGLPADARVERIDTHGAVVFLGPDRVLKLKRAVRFDFMDFSTVAKRRAVAAREVALNRRTAPTLYLGIAPIRRVDGGAELGALDTDPDPGAAGDDPAIIDWVVAMRRFEPETLFDRQAAAGSLSDGKLIALARAIAAFHAEAETVPDTDWPAATAEIARGNLRDIAGDAAFGTVEAKTLDTACEARLTRDARALAGRCPAVRRCHGDLHLRNICEVAGTPTLFDGIEFNDAFATIDPLYDLAFLLMDLDHRGLRAEAALVRDRYVEATDSVAGHGLMPLYLSMRAAVRAKVGAAGAAVQAGADHAAAMRDEARAYLSAAIRYLSPPAPKLIAVGGISGTGKSGLARALAPSIGAAPGAVVLRSDWLRKARFGAAETDRLPESAYASRVSRAVYATMEERAAALLADGVSVIADATFTHPDSRARIAAVAARAGVPFHGLWLTAPAGVLTARVTARRGDASDADAAVLRRQLAAGAGTVDWPHLSAGGPRADLRDRALRMVQDGGETETHAQGLNR